MQPFPRACFGGATGIDSVAEVASHERWHNILINEINGGAVDSDMDLIADYREAGLGLTVGNRDTFGLVAKNPVYATYGDGEYAVMLFSNGKTGDASKDWSKGGKQW